jgi:hypothetical protein
VRQVNGIKWEQTCDTHKEVIGQEWLSYKEEVTLAIPRVFLSSTCYDLAQVRDSLRSFIESYGFDPCLSDHGDVFYHPDIHTHDSCLSEISNCHLLILLIGGRFGGGYVADPSRSVVNAEYAAAKELGIPVFSFVKKDVLDDHRLYRKNKDNAVISRISFPSMENQEYAIKIFEFIDDVRLSKVNNGFFSFEYSRDIEDYLRKQWAGMFFDFLQKRRLADEYQLNNRLLSNLTSTTEKLEEIVKSMYRQVDQHADTVIDHVETMAQAEKFFRDLQSYYSVRLFPRTPVEKLLAIPTSQPWYRFLSSTNDFEIIPNVSDEDGDRTSDILTHKDTRSCISVEGDLSQYEESTVQDYEKDFLAFTKLSIDQKRQIVQQFTAATKVSNRIARKLDPR